MWKRAWEEGRGIWQLCRPRLRSALAFSLAFKAFHFIVLAPLAAAVLRMSLWLWGRPSASNFELAAFLLSPQGLAALVGVGCLLLAALYLELSGLFRLLIDPSLHWWEAFKSSTHLFPRLVQLGLRQVLIYLLAAVPFLAGIGLAYWWFWSGKDLNGLTILKPPEFWWGAVIAGAIASAYGVVALRILLRQLYAVPILIVESAGGGGEALRWSAARSQGALWTSAQALAGWFLVQSLLAAAVLGLLQAVLLALLHKSAGAISTIVLTMGIVLAIQLLVSSLLSVLANISFVAVVLALYRRVAPAPVNSALAKEVSPAKRKTPADSRGWMLAGGLVASLFIVLLGSRWAARELRINDELEITAHRAGASAAPENTLAALRQAIADRAEWAEIDVQLTSDKALVVMHDIDLARVGGGNRRVDQVTLAEIQTLDVGGLFGPQFAGEHIPTLSEMLAEAGDRIRLNIELKPHGKEDAPELTRRVIDEVRQAQLVSRSRLCSQSYESLQLARQLEPQLELGYIEATGVGDSTRLDVDFLMIKSSLATSQLVARAKLRGKQIHAWTVNDPALVAPLLDAGVANLITDDPARMRRQLDEIRALPAAERLLLRAATALAR